MRRYSYSTLTEARIRDLCRRPAVDFESAFQTVKPIIEDVRTKGDNAVLDYTEHLVRVRPVDLVVTVKDAGGIQLPEETKIAFDTAYTNIFSFHQAQYPKKLTVETMPGVVCSRVAKPIEKVGLYIPGGTAVLPSSVLMLGVPAKIAGCSEIVIATACAPPAFIM